MRDKGMSYELWFKGLAYLALIALAIWVYSAHAECMTVQSGDTEFINCTNGYNSTIIRSGNLILDSHGNSAIILDEPEDRPLHDYLIIDDWDTESDEDPQYDDWLED